MSKWDSLKEMAKDQADQNKQTVKVSYGELMEVIADAEREGANKSDAIYTERTPDGWIEFRRINDRSLIMKFPMSRLQEYLDQAAKPKSVVEEIREEIGKREEGLREGWDEVAEALLEAVDWFKTCQGNMAPSRSNWPDAALKEILAVLNGEKRRTLPNPKKEYPEPRSPKQIGDKVVKELMELNNIQDAKALFSRLLGQVWGGSGSQIQRLRGNIEYEISIMQDKYQGSKILKWFDLYEEEMT